DFKFLSDFLSPALTPIRFPSSVLRGSEHRLPATIPVSDLEFPSSKAASKLILILPSLGGTHLLTPLLLHSATQRTRLLGAEQPLKARGSHERLVNILDINTASWT
ncbi:hypothetical protein Gorai_014479, partial [Gossypium raimondii]|nr:hypothetical protein [Gossypium raimondii]